MARGEKIMYKYEGRDNYIDNWYKGFFGLYFYETDSEEYGICDGFTFTFLGNNFNFVRRSNASTRGSNNYDRDTTT
jgi:hypothetical protein